MRVDQITRIFLPTFKTPFDELETAFIKGSFSDAIKICSRPLEFSDYEEPEFTTVKIRPGMQHGFINFYHPTLLEAFCKYFQVKLMWKNYIDREDAFRIKKGFNIFGTPERVTLFIDIVLRYINKMQRYQDWFIYNYKPKDDRRRLKQEFNKHLVKLNGVTIKTLKAFKNKEGPHWYLLEKYIRTTEKLNYRDYPGTRVYDHAISKPYSHKRVLL